MFCILQIKLFHLIPISGFGLGKKCVYTSFHQTLVVIQISGQLDSGKWVKLSLQDFIYTNTHTKYTSQTKACNKHNSHYHIFDNIVTYTLLWQRVNLFSVLGRKLIFLSIILCFHNLLHYILFF